MGKKSLIFSLSEDKSIFKLLCLIISVLLLSACSSIGSFTSESNVDQPNTAKKQAPYLGGEYRIGPEDVLDISVWREETLTQKVVVRPDGGISYPLVGDLKVSGKTTEEVRKEITERLKKYIPEPAVNVAVSQVSGYRIYVLGQVNKPGQYVVGRYVDVLQALTLAGGLTPFASENNIKILRREDDREVVLPFAYAAVKKGQDLQQNIILKSDDVIVVP
jgi:polysaccharide export outer membrane protein